MYDLSPFDDKRLKLISWWGRHAWIMAVAGAAVTVAAVQWRINPILPLLLTIFGASYLWLMSGVYLPGTVFARRNNAGKFFLQHSTDWDFMRDQYQSMKRSAYIKGENYVWSLTVMGAEVALMFTDDGGCVAWLQLPRKFPHLVVDSLADNHPWRRQMSKRSLPPERIRLEGTFPDYFHVYQEPGQQVLTLQILSPDRMAYLVDDLRDVNIEIQDAYLRLFAAHAQHSSRDFQAFLDTLTSFQKGLKVAGIGTILE